MTSDLSPKKRLFEQFARVAKALASANRLELLEALAQGERSVDALAQASGMSVANTSHHLQILRDSGLALSRKEGLQVFYRLSDDAYHYRAGRHPRRGRTPPGGSGTHRAGKFRLARLADPGEARPTSGNGVTPAKRW